MVKAYLAGDGLKKGNQILRNMERDAINALGTVDLFNPWDQKDINNKANNPTAEAIFAKDTAAILESDIIVCDVDNLSTGTVSEMGQIWGVNYVMQKIHRIFSKADEEVKRMVANGTIHGRQAEQQHRDKLIVSELLTLMLQIPVKTVHWQTTDIRDTDIPEAGHRRSHSLNQYLYGMMLDMAGEAKSFKTILDELKAVDA